MRHRVTRASRSSRSTLVRPFACELLEERRLLTNGYLYFSAPASQSVAEGNSVDITVVYAGMDYTTPPVFNYTVGGTATHSGAGADHEALSGSVTLTPGVFPYAFGTITVATKKDNLVEATAESVVLTVSASPGNTVGMPGSSSGTEVTVNIDDDPPIVTIAATDGTATETETGQTADTGTFTITRTGGDTATPLPVTVGFSGVAIHGTDFTASSTVDVTTSGTITVAMLGDEVDEGTESIVATLTGGGANYEIGTPASAKMAAQDNDYTFSWSATRAGDPTPIARGANTTVTVTVTQGGNPVQGVNFLSDALGPNFAFITINGVTDAQGKASWRIGGNANGPVGATDTFTIHATIAGKEYDLSRNLILD